jgi:hypothetical protein
MPVKGRDSKRVWRDQDDAPAWSEAQFARAEVAVAGKVLQPAQGNLTRRRSRPKKPDAKKHILIRR